LSQFAIEVEKHHASSFNPPRAKILESAETEENGAVGFIVEFEDEDLPDEVMSSAGVVSAEPLW
jgi:hypothetical protein